MPPKYVHYIAAPNEVVCGLIQVHVNADGLIIPAIFSVKIATKILVRGEKKMK